VVFFGIERGDYRASGIRFNDETLFEMITPIGTQEIRLRVPGRHTIANALAAAAACVVLGVSLSDVAQGLREFTPPSWRMEILSLPGGRILIRDCYNANPQSVCAALDVLAQRGRGQKTLAVLADMLELGPESEKHHEEVGKRAALLGIDRVIFVGSFGGFFQDGFVAARGNRGRVTWARTKEAAWDAVKPELENYRVTLVKGSRAMKMETIADLILQEK
jgi:UDP-N-acetylmuramoyl-tripeptide--D-alanyl-D-alanine ligase